MHSVNYIIVYISADTGLVGKQQLLYIVRLYNMGDG